MPKPQKQNLSKARTRVLLDANLDRRVVAYVAAAAAKGANGGGTAFELSPAGGQWTEALLYSFPAFPTDGFQPWGGLVLAANGDLYGTTYYGGNGCNTGGCGTVYQLTPHAVGPWTETIVHNFESALYGSESSARLLVDNKGERLFGMTEYGGSMYGYGTVFMIQK